jgi:hypothetical protein
MPLFICTLKAFDDMKKTSTKKATKVKYCEDVNNEFFTRFYDLLYTNYHNEEPKPIETFPPMKPGSEAKAETQQAFNSKIVDLRIKRAFDKKLNNKEHEETNETDEKDKFEKRMENNEEQIDEVFEKVGITISPIPTYIANQMKDEVELKAKNERKNKRVNMKEVEAEFTRRLKQSEQRGRERALRRNAKLQGVEDHDEFMKTYKNSKSPIHQEKPFILKV